MVFAVAIRLKIVTELHMREMSAVQFNRAFGGGALSRVSQNFNKLAETDWLRLVRTAPPGGRRHGAVEHFYRATEPAYCDADSWALVPYSLRVAWTWNIYKQVAPKLRAAVEVANAGAEWARDLTCDQWELDEVGRKRAIEAVATQFQGIFEEQEDSRVRAQNGEGALKPADVFVVAFDSAGSCASPHAGGLVELRIEPLVPFTERLAPVLIDDLSLAIAGEMNQREVSSTQYYREVGGASKQRIWRQFRGLERTGWAARVAERTGNGRRGRTEHFYRATKPRYAGFDACAEPPASKRSERWQTFERFCADAVGSMEAGAFDARTDRYVTWSNVLLDERGWERVITGLNSLRKFLLREEQRSRQRMKTSGLGSTKMTVALAAMERAAEVKAP
ncbi:MAG: hypothetical protein WDZ46_01120 [Solirubrobacterales bacterium]